MNDLQVQPNGQILMPSGVIPGSVITTGAILMPSGVIPGSVILIHYSR